MTDRSGVWRWLHRPVRPWHWLLELLLPATCLGCDELGRSPWCEPCARRLPFAPRTPWGVEGVPLHAPFLYAPPASAAVRRFKYDGRADFAFALASLMHERLATCGESGANLIVPVPLHERRLAERGFNQAALLSRVLGQRLGIACAPTALVRTRSTVPQARMARDGRLRNLQSAFRASQPHKLNLHRVLLVDDVVTTGATARACMDAIREAGADVVGVVSVCAALK
ncbi:ComF family protein [Myxococcota bacterium]